MTPEQVMKAREMYRPDAEGRRYTVKEIQQWLIDEYGLPVGIQTIRNMVHRRTYAEVGFDPQDAGQAA